MRNFLLRFFRGRYGAYGSDSLTRFLLLLAIVLLFMSIALESLDFVFYLAIVDLAYCYFRLFSRNITKRYKENEAFKSITKKIVQFFKKT